jgi:predicted HicB family RNase H-like nuclease
VATEAEEPGVNVVVRFPIELRDAARDAAKAQDLSMAQLIRRAVRDEIDRRTEGTG